MNHNQFAKEHHQRVVDKGYCDTECVWRLPETCKVCRHERMSKEEFRNRVLIDQKARKVSQLKAKKRAEQEVVAYVIESWRSRRR